MVDRFLVRYSVDFILPINMTLTFPLLCVFKHNTFHGAVTDLGGVTKNKM